MKGIALALLFLTQSLFATTYSSSHSYFTRVHFSDNAFGKKVIAVYAHMGVLTRRSSGLGGGYYWDNVRHEALVKSGDHFEGRFVLGGSSSYEHHYAEGPVIQYWVYFEDGAHMITTSNRVPVHTRERYSADTEEGRKAWKRAYETHRVRLESQTIGETIAIELELYHVG